MSASGGDSLNSPIRRMTSPSLYLQGKGALYYLGQKAVPYGNKAYVIGGKTALEVAGQRIRKSLESNGISIVGWNDTVKECTRANIDRLAEEGKRAGPHFVIGAGGGKAVDTAKAVAWRLKIPAMTVGTQCATNADASAESVIYTEDHKYLEFIALPRNPVIVIEDTEILSKAPIEYIIRGMGDALSAKFEGEAYAKARAKRKDREVPTHAAIALGEACYNSLMENGIKAVKDLKSGVHSHEVDQVIEAVKLSSAMAFENTGCALAHALHNGLTRTGQVTGHHGELVAYGTIVQAAYERRTRDEVRILIEWCEKLGLPTKLKMIGDPPKAALRAAAEYAAERDPDSHNMPERVKPAELLRVIEQIEHGF